MKLPHFFQRFRKNKNGERIRIDEDLKNEGNGYFRKIGGYFKTAQILLLVLTFLFVTVFALVNSESITYQNLYYFLRDFRTAVDKTDLSAEGIAYEIDSEVSFAAFKGGIAVAGRERLQILTASGGVNLSSSLGMAKPKMSPSTDLLLVYGQGETAYHIYNSFVRIHAEDAPGVIRTATLSESGAYAIVTEDESYTSAVYVYTKKFQKCNKYGMNTVVTSVALAANGKTVAILSYDIKEGNTTVHLRLCEVGTDRVYCDYIVENDFPLGVSFTENDEVLLLTENGLHSVNVRDGGALLENLSLETVSLFSLGTSGAAILLSSENGTGGILKCYDKSGKYQFSHNTEHNVRLLTVNDRFVFYKTENEVVSVEKETGYAESVKYTAYGGELVVMGEKRIACCYVGEAKYISFGETSLK